MKSAYEAALERCLLHQRDGCPVPPITEPLGRYWEQPDPTNWLFSPTEVLMPAADLLLLSDYSYSQPSAVYEGKMWRLRNFPERDPNWYLHWWGPSENPQMCRNHVRKIITI